jgi:hypothetical protein
MCNVLEEKLKSLRGFFKYMVSSDEERVLGFGRGYRGWGWGKGRGWECARKRPLV